MTQQTEQACPEKTESLVSRLEGADYFAFSRRSSSASTASRMNRARPYVPATASIRSITDSGNRTCVAFMPSAGRPMRGAVVDTDMSGKLIKNDTVCIDGVIDVVYIDGIDNGSNPMTFHLDTSGVVHIRTEPHGDWRGIGYANLSPFTQGYIEAAMAELYKPETRGWRWSGEHNGYIRRDYLKAGRGGTYAGDESWGDYPSDVDAGEAWGADSYSDMPAFHMLAPETLARIIADCERAEAQQANHTYQSTGKEFWKVRQARDVPGFPWLVVCLGDDGKVRFA